ncbi:MAG TPA: hypothetical protein VKC60_02280 [Opitutaceae bacterium]|nr:hypothetical protein [Opitutaceae bacterium]
MDEKRGQKQCFLGGFRASKSALLAIQKSAQKVLKKGLQSGFFGGFFEVENEASKRAKLVTFRSIFLVRFEAQMDVEIRSKKRGKNGSKTRPRWV